MNSEIIKDNIVIDFKKLFNRLLSYWWLFLICLGLGIAISKFYLRYATFEYSARAILLIKDAGKSGNISEQSILVQDQLLGGGAKAMDNEIQILKSLTLMEKVVERHELNVSYFRKGTVKESELYLNTPFELDSFSLVGGQGFEENFYIQLKDYETFLFKLNEDDEEGVRHKFGVPFENEAGRFLINLSATVAVIPGDYRLKVSSVEACANQIQAKLNIQRIGDHSASSVLNLNIIDPVAEKATQIINTLIDIYNEEEIKDENKVLENTLEFIDNRVSFLINELDSVEGGIQRYKSANEIISSSATASMDYTLGEIRESIQRISEYDVQKNLLKSLETFLVDKDGEFELIPANLAAETPVLSGLVGQYNDLVLRHKQVSIAASLKNPVRVAIEEQMVDIRKLVIETIRNLQKDLQIPIQKIERNIQELKSSMSSVPGIEKKLIEKMRMQAVKENLFLYLLQKREETALSEAVTTAKTRTIDRARVAKAPVYPRRKFILAAGALLGLIVPLILVLIIGLFDTKVDSEETIKQITNIPILGRIAFKKGAENIVVKQGNRSAINEMFRLLRTNLNFINHSKDQQTLLITSSVSGEGKTFITINLGLTLALSNKKVLIIGLDLRRPKLASYLGQGNSKGVTNYLVGQNSLDEIIQPFEGHPNLSFITSGPVPPNPAELILSEQMETFLTELKTRFDYILFDTPPMGLVSDALLLRNHVDNILVVVHQNKTRKIMLKNMEELYADKQLEKASIVFNGVKKSNGYYGYGGYNNKYNQEYYVDEE